MIEVVGKCVLEDGHEIVQIMGIYIDDDHDDDDDDDDDDGDDDDGDEDDDDSMK